MAEPKALATVTDLSEWIGETINEGDADGKRAAMCLRLASSLVRGETGRDWVDTSGELVDPLPEAVFSVTLYVASRVYENRQAQNRGGVDDYQEGFKVDEAGAYLTQSERRMLARLSASGVGISTISTYKTDTAGPAGLVPTGTPNVEFPWY